MKRIIILVLVFFCTGLNAQTAFFIDKKGKKTMMRDDSVEIVVVDDRISYAEVGKEWEKYIRFKDLDYAIVGPYYFKSFKLIDEKGKPKKETAYFVVNETLTKKLLVYYYTLIGKYSSTDFHFVYVIDNNYNIIDCVNEITRAKQHLDKRKKVVSMIKSNFSDSPGLINELDKYINDEDKLDILDFLSHPKYIK